MSIGINHKILLYFLINLTGICTFHSIALICLICNHIHSLNLCIHCFMVLNQLKYQRPNYFQLTELCASALYLAADSNHSSLVELLIRFGANPSAPEPGRPASGVL